MLTEKQDHLGYMINHIAELEDLLDGDSHTEIIEKAAREKLGYVYSDEIIYIDISGD